MALEDFMDDEDYGSLPGDDTGGSPLAQVGGAAAPGALSKATVLLHSQPSGGGAPTGLDLLRAYAINQLPERDQILAARQKATQAYLDQASAVQGLSPAGRAAPWFALAGGLGGPTKTGDWGESLGRGSAAFGKALQDQSVEQGLRDRLAAELRVKGAGVEAEGVETDLKTSLPALARLAAADRVAKATSPFSIQKSGSDIVIIDKSKTDAAGAPLVVKRIEATRVWEIYKENLKIAAKEAETMKFPGGPTQREEWVKARAKGATMEWMGGNFWREQERAATAEEDRPALGGGTAPQGPVAVAPTAPTSPGTATPAAPATGEPGTLSNVTPDTPSGKVFQFTAPNLEEAKRMAQQFEAQGLKFKITTPPGTASPAAPPLTEDEAQNARELGRVPSTSSPVPALAAPAGVPTIRDPVQEEVSKRALGEAGKNDADLVKEAQVAADGARALRSSAQSALMLSDKVFHGPAAEIGNMVGGWVASFFPDSKIATKVGMTEAYIAQVANLVRSKIQALGTGNAISNADLMFTEKSLGSILTTAKGKRAILTGLMLDSMTIEAEATNKAKWFHDHGGTLKGYTRLTDQTGGYPLFVAGKNGVVSFESYKKTYQERFPNATPQEIMKDWQSESRRAAASLVTGR